MDRAVERVCERLTRAKAALESAGIPHAVIGGNAAAAHIGRVDESAVRNTRDIDILVGKDDLARVVHTFHPDDFARRHPTDPYVFLDGEEVKPWETARLVFAGETVDPGWTTVYPDTADAESIETYRVISLSALVPIELTTFRDKDKTHLRDLIGVGLVDASWYERLDPGLADRLRSLIETPGR